jgi:DNA repair protein RecO (recombination protein O)
LERFADRAVVLSTLDYGDADKLVTLFTLAHGKLTAFAAGARKSRRRFAGALEPGTLLGVQLVERRGSTVRLDQADIARSLHGLREDLSRIARALYCLELCRELVRDREPHPELFLALVDYLEQLDLGRAGPTSLVAFELSALARAGLMPRFDRCALCGSLPGPGSFFDPEHGGVVCEGCKERALHPLRIAPELALGLSRLQQGVREPLGPEQRQRARELLNHFIAHHLGRRIKSVDFLAQLGAD